MALARTMANEWAPHGIRVNCVAPDVIGTPRVLAGFTEKGITDPNSIVADEVPLARWASRRRSPDRSCSCCPTWRGS